MVALAEWIQPEKTDIEPKTRVGDFFGRDREGVGENEPQVVECDWEITLHIYESRRSPSLARSNQRAEKAIKRDIETKVREQLQEIFKPLVKQLNEQLPQSYIDSLEGNPQKSAHGYVLEINDGDDGTAYLSVSQEARLGSVQLGALTVRAEYEALLSVNADFEMTSTNGNLFFRVNAGYEGSAAYKAFTRVTIGGPFSWIHRHRDFNAAEGSLQVSGAMEPFIIFDK